MNKTKAFHIYLFSAFVPAWILQICAGFFYQSSGANLFYTVLLLLAMYCPFLGVLTAKMPLKDMGWQIHLKDKKWLFFLTAWFLLFVLGFCLTGFLSGLEVFGDLLLCTVQPMRLYLACTF